MPAENQIILPTPITKVRSIWPVLSNDKVQVKIRPLNKILPNRGSESFELTTKNPTLPEPTLPTLPTLPTRKPAMTKKPKMNKKKVYNKIEDLNDIKRKSLIN